MDAFFILEPSPLQIIGAAFFLACVVFLVIPAVLRFMQERETSVPVTESRSTYRYQRKQFFMTRPENDFYQGLRTAVGNDYIIFAQVHLPTIVDEKVPGQDWRAARASINRKSVDFVLCDPIYLNPKLAIELDDSSHDKPERRERDAMVESILKQAELPLLRVRYGENITASELKSRIQSAL